MVHEELSWLLFRFARQVETLGGEKTELTPVSRHLGQERKTSAFGPKSKKNRDS